MWSRLGVKRTKHTWFFSDVKQHTSTAPTTVTITTGYHHHRPDSTDLLQQVDGVPAAEHLGGEGGGGRGAPVLLDLLQKFGHAHTLGHGPPQARTHRDKTGTDRHTESWADGSIPHKR